MRMRHLSNADFELAWTLLAPDMWSADGYKPKCKRVLVDGVTIKDVAGEPSSHAKKCLAALCNSLIEELYVTKG